MRTLLLVESNTTGTGRLFARRARELGYEPVLAAADPTATRTRPRTASASSSATRPTRARSSPPTSANQPG